MKKLINALNEFNIQQIDKFVARIERHKGSTITNDADFDLFLTGNNKDRLEKHLLDEVLEYFTIPLDKRKEIINIIITNRLYDGIQDKECIDISNLSFLLWVIKTRGY